jgi:hypothetical protein
MESISNASASFFQNVGDAASAESPQPQGEGAKYAGGASVATSTYSKVSDGLASAWEKLKNLGSSAAASVTSDMTSSQKRALGGGALIDMIPVPGSGPLQKKLMESLPPDDQPPMKGIQEQLAQGEGPAST